VEATRLREPMLLQSGQRFADGDTAGVEVLRDLLLAQRITVLHVPEITARRKLSKILSAAEGLLARLDFLIRIDSAMNRASAMRASTATLIQRALHIGSHSR
jgi:hypothetical protein